MGLRLAFFTTNKATGIFKLLKVFESSLNHGKKIGAKILKMHHPKNI
jgi:hypothetical protein